MKIKVESPTIWGYEQDDIKCARKLLELGITPQELKDCMHDFRMVARIIQEDNERMMNNAYKSALEGYYASRH